MAEDYDFYDVVAAQRLKELNAAEQQCRASLMQCEASGDLAEASEFVQLLGNVRAEKQNLLNLHSQHTASKQPRYAPPLTDQEWQSRPAEKMTLEDSWRLANSGKYGCDPLKFQEGMAEVIRRKQAGEP